MMKYMYMYFYLGLWLSENMSWDKHVEHVLKRSVLTIVNLLKMSHHFDRRVKLAIHTTYIRPLLEYATPVFNGNLSKTQVDSNSLENVHRRALVASLGVYRPTFHSKLLHESGIEPLAIRRKYFGLCHIYKII